MSVLSMAGHNLVLSSYNELIMNHNEAHIFTIGLNLHLYQVFKSGKFKEK